MEQAGGGNRGFYVVAEWFGVKKCDTFERCVYLIRGNDGIARFRRYSAGLKTNLSSGRPAATKNWKWMIVRQYLKSNRLTRFHIYQPF